MAGIPSTGNVPSTIVEPGAAIAHRFGAIEAVSQAPVGGARTEIRNEETRPVGPGPRATPLDLGSVAETQAVTEPATGAEKETVRGEERAAKSAEPGAEDVRRRQRNKEGPDGLTEEERRRVAELKRRDREVRAHEQAHRNAGGPFVGPPRFHFVRGPNGQFFAVGGEVSIDASPVPNNPEATIRKMQVVKRAALAPQQPSAQDQRVAAEAEAKITRARQEIREREQKAQAEAARRRREQLEERAVKKKEPGPSEQPPFDPEARFRVENGGTGPIGGPGLAGTGGLDVTLQGTLDPGTLFNLVA